MGFGNAVAMTYISSISRIFVLDTVGPTVWVIDTTVNNAGPPIQSVNGVIASYNVGLSGVPSTVLYAIGYDSNTTHMIFLADGASNTVYKINPTTGAVTSETLTATDVESQTLNGPIAAMSTGENTDILSLIYNYNSGTNFIAADMLNNSTSQDGTYYAPIPAWHSISFYQNGLVAGSAAPNGFYVDASGNQGAFANSAPYQYEYPFPSGLNTSNTVVKGGFYLISSDNNFIYFPVYFTSTSTYNIIRMNISSSFYNTQTVPVSTIPTGNVVYSSSYEYLFVSDTGLNTILYGRPGFGNDFVSGVNLPEGTFSLVWDDNTTYSLQDQFGIWALAPTHLYRWSIPQTGLSSSDQHYIYLPTSSNYSVAANLSAGSSITASISESIAALITTDSGISASLGDASEIQAQATTDSQVNAGTDINLGAESGIQTDSQIFAILYATFYLSTAEVADSAVACDLSVIYAITTLIIPDSNVLASLNQSSGDLATGALIGNSSLGARPSFSTPFEPARAVPNQPEPPPAPMVHHKYRIKLPSV